MRLVLALGAMAVGFLLGELVFAAFLRSMRR
jgi:hypothetical protein